MTNKKSRLQFRYCLIGSLAILLAGLHCQVREKQKERQGGQQDSPAIEGLFVYWADAALLTACDDGEKRPVAMEKDYLALERAYLQHRKSPGQALLVRINGYVDDRPAMEGERKIKKFIVEKFIAILPDTTCADNSRSR